MFLKLRPFAVLACTAFAACSTEYSVTPLAQDGQQIRYTQGRATAYSEKIAGALQVTPLGLNDSMRPSFRIAAFNKSNGPSNFGVENVSVELADGSADKVFTSAELQQEAKVDAQWAKAATILVGGLAAGAAQANAYSTTTGSVSSNYGSASFYARTYDPTAAYLGTASAAAATGYGIHRIESALDATLANYRNNILQTTTLDSGQSYGGVVVADRLSASKFPENVVLRVKWNGDDYDFHFLVAEGGPPPQTVAPPAPLPPSFAEPSPSRETVRGIEQQPALVSFDQWNKKKPAGH